MRRGYTSGYGRTISEDIDVLGEDVVVEGIASRVVDGNSHSRLIGMGDGGVPSDGDLRSSLISGASRSSYLDL